MATRVISTKLAIEGESSYRASLSQINSEIKSLQSTLRLTESEYRNNANSMATLTAKGESLSNLYKTQEEKVKTLTSALENAQKAEQAYTQQKAELEEKIAANNKRLEELKNTTGDTAKEEKLLTDENRELNGQLADCEARLSAAEKGVNSWQGQLNNAQIKLNDLDAEIELNKEYLNEAKNSTDGCATSIDRFGERVDKSADGVSEFSEALTAAGIIAGLKAMADSMEECVRASVDFESAMAGVKRTVGGSDEFISQMGETFKDLSTEIPITTSELAGIATTAGQLGVAQEKVEGFATVMAKLATTTDLTADMAATMLAQFSNITGTRDYERLGATVAELGDATATTASKVVDMSQGMAAAANMAGMSAPDILAIAASVGSLGIEASSGATAMSTLISNMNKAVETGDKLDAFASVSGMSAEQFKVAWGENAVSALNSFIQGLNDTERNGKSAVALLDDLSIKNVRQTRAILGLASAGDLLGNTIRQANAAWEENTALEAKASVMYGTTEAKMTMLANSADNARIAIGDKLTPAVGNLAEAGTQMLDWISGVIDGSGNLVPAVTAGGVAVGVMAAAVVGYTAVSKLAAAATAMLTAAMETNPFFLATAGVAALTAGVAAFILTADDSLPKVKDLTTAARELNDTVNDTDGAFADSIASIDAAANVADRYIGRLRELEAAGLETEEQQREYHNTLILLTETVPELAQYINLETDSIEGGTAALARNTEAWKRNAEAQAYQELYTEIVKQHASAILEAETNSVRLTQAESDLKDARERQTKAIQTMDSEYAKAQKAADEYYKQTGNLANAEDFLSDEYREAQGSLNDLTKEIAEGEERQKRYAEAVDEGGEAADNAEKEIAVLDEAMKNLTSSTEDNTDATAENSEVQEAAGEAVESTAGSLASLSEEYDKAMEKADKSIGKQISLFDEFDAEVTADMDSVSEMTKRWAEQTENLANYTENLQKAAKYGLDEGLVLSLSDGSEKSAGYLGAIIKEIEDAGTTTEGLSDKAQGTVDQFNESFGAREQALEDFKATAMGLSTDFEGVVDVINQAAEGADFSGVARAIDEAFHGVNTEQNANELIDSFEAPFRERKEDLYAQAHMYGSGATEGISDALSTAGAIGEKFDLDLAEKIRLNASSVTDEAQAMGESLKDTVTKSATDTVEEFDKKFKPITQKATSTTEDMVSGVESAANALPLSMRSVGEESINGMIRGMNNKSGALYSTMTGIVNASLRAARSAAQVASPSRKTIEMFEHVGEGMAVGVERKRERVKSAVRDVAKDALKLDITGTATLNTPELRMPEIKMPGRRAEQARLTSFEDKLDSMLGWMATLNRTIIEHGDVILDGKSIVSGTVKEMSRQLEYQREREVRA